MPIRNANWYNGHSTRKYPLADTATGLTDDGRRLPDDILVDCRLRWPAAAGQYAYIGGVTVTERLVTLTFVAADSPTSAADFVPLGTVSLLKPVTAFRHYAIKPQLAGVGGFVVFGDTEEAFVGRFSLPTQTLLLPDAAQPTRTPPIPTLRRMGRNVGLENLVRILGGNDVQVVRESILIDGAERDALVLRLIQGNFSENVLQRYIGPCGGRPESRTCLKDGIERINDVTCDCEGNINITFVGLTAGPYESCGESDAGAGVTLDQSVGMQDVCAERAPDRFEGVDRCEELDSSLSSASGSSISDSGSPDPDPGPGPSLSSVSCTDTLPYVETFDGSTADDFNVVSGSFDFSAVDSPTEGPGDPPPYVSYTATDGSRRNVALLDYCAIVDTLEKRITAHVALTNTFAQENGGIVINYHEVDILTNPHIEYFAAVIDRRVNRVRLLRFNGAALIVEHEVSPSAPFVLGHWYQIQVETTLGATPIISVAVTGVTNPLWGSVSFSVSTNKYLPSDDGQFGVTSDRAAAHFSFLVVETI